MANIKVSKKNEDKLRFFLSNIKNVINPQPSNSKNKSDSK